MEPAHKKGQRNRKRSKAKRQKAKKQRGRRHKWNSNNSLPYISQSEPASTLTTKEKNPNKRKRHAMFLNPHLARLESLSLFQSLVYY